MQQAEKISFQDTRGLSKTIPTGLLEISNFFIFQLFQKILSRGRSPGYPLPSPGGWTLIGPAILEPIGVKQQDSPPLCNLIPKARSLRSLAFDHELASD